MTSGHRHHNSILFLVLLFRSWSLGWARQYGEVEFASIRGQRRVDEDSSNYLRELMSSMGMPMSMMSKGKKSKGKMSKGKKSKGKVSKGKMTMMGMMPKNPKTFSPTITQYPATPSPTGREAPAATTNPPTLLTFRTFSPTIGASVAPTYLMTIAPSNVGGKSPKPTFPKPTSKPTSSSSPIPMSQQPTKNPSMEPTAGTANPTGAPVTPPVKPTNSPIKPTKAPVVPTTPSPPPVLQPTPPPVSPPTQTPPPVSPPTPPPVSPPTPPPVSPPTQNLSPTAAPSKAAAPMVVDLSPFALNYTLAVPRIPFRTEYVDLATASGTYLTSFFRSTLTSQNSYLQTVIVIYKSGTVFFGEPINVQYGAVASFSPNSTTIPTVVQLDNTLNQAFTGSNVPVYVDFLQTQLPTTNTFSTTTNVTLATSSNRAKVYAPIAVSDNSSMGSTGKVNESRRMNALSAVAISIGAVAAAALLVAAAVSYRRYSRFDPTTNINRMPPKYGIVASANDGSTIDDGSSLTRERRYQGFNDSDDGCDGSINSSSWKDFIPDSERSYKKKTPKQIMNEMDLVSALGETSQRSS